MMMKRRRQVDSHETLPSSARSSTGDIDIPLDLTLEILKKLPAKSLVRFRCVSKLWSSIISRRRDFIESIVARSRTQPPCDAYLIFEHMFLGTTTSELSLVFASTTTCPINTWKHLLGTPGGVYQHVRGLILCLSEYGNEGIIYNPTTRQAFELPETKAWGLGSFLFGYDPLGNQYKVVFLPEPFMEQKTCQVFTLGDPTAKRWRPLQGFECHSSCYTNSDIAVCIKGAIYFAIYSSATHYAYKLMSFDVRSEEFHHVESPQTLLHHHLINYQGKLGFVCFDQGVEIWVREDSDQTSTQGWSNIVFYDGMVDFEEWRISGVTRDGEIVFVDSYYYADHIRVLCYDPKRNCVRFVDLGATSPRRPKSILIRTLPDYVETTMCLD